MPISGHRFGTGTDSSSAADILFFLAFAGRLGDCDVAITGRGSSDVFETALKRDRISC